jgi:hypothetical protein
MEIEKTEIGQVIVRTITADKDFLKTVRSNSSNFALHQVIYSNFRYAKLVNRLTCRMIETNDALIQSDYRISNSVNALVDQKAMNAKNITLSLSGIFPADKIESIIQQSNTLVNKEIFKVVRERIVKMVCRFTDETVYSMIGRY